nr:hypothetical protein [Polymorphobacter sp.]
MRSFMPLAAIAILSISVPARAGQTIIPAGDAFMFGGEQTAPVAINGRNSGRIPVEISAEVQGMTVYLRTVAPGQDFEQVFGSGQIAIFRNTSKTARAALQFDLTDEVKDLEMRYRLAPEK